MKLHPFFRLATALPWVFCFQFSFASFGVGSVMGRVIDPSDKTPVGGATVVFDCQGVQHDFTANDKGYYYASNIQPGVYTVTAVFMGKSTTVTGVKVGSDEQKELNFELTLAINPVGGSSDTAVVVVATRGRKPPLIDPFNPEVYVLTPIDIKEMPVINIDGLTEQQSGITAIGGSYYVHGARADGLAYYIDGCRIMGTAVVPLTGLDTYKSYTGFIPVKYGDTTGGVIVMETRSYFTEEH